jgi:hypothetical protein
VLQAPILDSLSSDPLVLPDDSFSPAETGICGRDVIQTFMVTLVNIALDERLDLAFEVVGQEMVFQQDAVRQGLVPALDFALGSRVDRHTAHLAHVLGFDIVS